MSIFHKCKITFTEHKKRMNRISYPNKFLFPIVVGKMEEIVAAPEEENGAWTAEIIL